MILSAPGWLVLLVPVAALAAWTWRHGRRSEPALGYADVAPLRALASPAAALAERARPWARVAALALLAVAIARPQQGLKDDERDLQATDIMLCLDLSASMQAEDFAPKTRVQAARDCALRFVAGREHDRIGLVVFAEIAMTVCPLTTDHDALAGELHDMDIGEVPPNRTAIGDALAAAVERLKSSAAKSKVIVLLTDGGNNAGVVDPLTAAKTAASFGIKVHTIGAGAPGGGWITRDDPMFGRRRFRMAEDLDEETLTKIASATGGEYFRAANLRGMESIFGKIDAMEKTEIRTRNFTEYLDRFEWFLLPALALLAAELVLGRIVLKGVPA